MQQCLETRELNTFYLCEINQTKAVFPGQALSGIYTFPNLDMFVFSEVIMSWYFSWRVASAVSQTCVKLQAVLLKHYYFC